MTDFDVEIKEIAQEGFNGLPMPLRLFGENQNIDIRAGMQLCSPVTAHGKQCATAGVVKVLSPQINDQRIKGLGQPAD